MKLCVALKNLVKQGRCGLAKQKIVAANRKGREITKDFSRRKGENFIKKTYERIKVGIIENI